MTKEPEAPPEDTPEEPVRRRWLTTLVVALTLALIYAIALFLTGRGNTAPPAALPVAAPVTIAGGFRPQSIAFFDEAHGLISGSVSCVACAGHRGGVIASTSDGGDTWSVRFRGERPILGLARIGKTREIWATATTCNNDSFIDCQLFRLHSSDLGQTWQPDQPKNPYVVSPPGAPISCGQDHPFPISSSFATRSLGWMLCAMDPVSVSYQFKALFETTDHGRDWTPRAHFHAVTGGATTNSGGLPIDGFAGGISFLKNGTGWVWTVGPESSLSVSSDSGNRWKPVWRPSDSSDRQIVAASLVAENVGYVAVTSPSTGDWLLVTHDGGRSWEPAQAWPAPLDQLTQPPG